MSDPFPRLTVNDQLIPPEAIAFELSRLVRFYSQHMPEDQVRQQLPALRRRALEQAIGARLLIEEAERLDIQVGDAEVDARLTEMTRQAGGTEKFQAALKKQQLDEPRLREQIRRGRRVDHLVERLTADAPEPTEAEIRAHFDAHQAEYSRPERVLAQHILVAPKSADEAVRAEAREKLETIRGRVVAGADFADEAAKHSDCPSGKQGGSLGWFARGMMVKEFDEAVFEMGVGELSEIVETSFGFHLIRKTDHEDPGDADFGDVHDGVRDFLRHARRGEVLSAHVSELRAKARIEGLPTA